MLTAGTTQIMMQEILYVNILILSHIISSKEKSYERMGHKKII